MITRPRATIDDLYRVEGKAELVGGEVLPLMPTGRMPVFAAGEIFVSLRVFVRQAGLPGMAVPDNAGFLVNLPNRQSFSPDAAYYEGPNSGMRFFEGAPRFAVEVRSENDYGPTAEQEMAQKRQDYFAAGTLVVWDVDLQSEDVVRRYDTANPTTPVGFRHGQIADAGASVPGWTIPVDDLFEP